MYSIEEVGRYWDEAAHDASLEERIAMYSRWSEYFSLLARRARDVASGDDVIADDVVDFLLREGIVTSGDSFLDVGCGSGDYSIRLSPHCARIDALDMNRDSIDTLMFRARAANLSNITPILSPWNDFVPNDRYDVVFCAMCPAICNREELLRFEQMSRSVACILTVARGSYDEHRKSLMSLLCVEPNRYKAGMISEVLHYYNNLYLMGRNPSVRSRTFDIDRSYSIDDIVEKYVCYFKIFDIATEVLEPIVREYFTQKATDGIVREHSTMNMALIYWKVREEGI